MINTKGNFLIVRSSAGSGKTYRLVQEYLRIALKTSKASAYRQILAVTFTNKAAQEMLERVIHQLATLSKTGTHDKDQMAITLCDKLSIGQRTLSERAKKVLEHMLHNYGDLSISTIDGFVNKVVRAFARDLKIMANYEIELEETLLLEEAVDRCISEIHKGSSLANALVKLMLDRSDEERNWRIEDELNLVAKNILNEKGHQNLLDQKELGLEDHQKIRNELYAKMKVFQNEVMKVGISGMELINSSNVPHDRFANGASSGLPGYFKRISKFDKIEPSVTQRKIIDQDKWHSGKADPSDIGEIEAIKDELRSLFNAVTKFIDEEQGRYIERKLVAEKLIALGVLSEIETHLKDIKDERDILLISDLNRMISKVVLNEPAPFIYERTGERYSNLLFDEFQDTSIMQWWNFLPLVENTLSKNGFSMVVGDGKQAIYRWRNGEVQQFLNLPEIFGHKNDPNILEKQAALIRNKELDHLADNWRSSPEIIQFNNDLFKDLSDHLPVSLKGIYDDLAQNARKKDFPGYVRIEQVLDDREVKSKDLVLQKVVEDINCVLENNGALRDITILVRGKADGIRVAEALESKNIDVISPEALLLSTHAGVNFIMDLMAVMCDREDLVSATKAITAASHMLNKKDIHDFLAKYIHKKNKRTYIDIDEFLFKEFKIEHSASLHSLPSYELAATLASDLGLLHNDDRYITHFLDSVLQVNKQQGGGLQKLMEWWKIKKDSIGLAVPERENAVTIMTIHKSKGLQFPVVIVPFANWGFSPKNGNDMWLDDPDQHYGAKHLLVKFTKDLEHTRYAEQYKNEQALGLLDNLNLLYVAFTRPERVLISYYGKTIKNTMSSIIHPALQTSSGWSYDQNILISGDFPDLEKNNQKIEDDQKLLRPMHSTSWFKRAVIDSSSITQLEDRPEKEHLQYGKMVHDLMMYIRSKNEIGPAIQKALQNEKIDKETAKDLLTKVNELLSLPEVAPYFSTDNNYLDEREICTLNGKALRPDRVILDEKEAVIIEYKTGEKRSRHMEQVNEYSQELEDMGYNVKDKLILYIDLMEAIRA